MADLRISELAALAGANLAAGDLLAIVDVSASETKKITVTDLVGNATTLIADATIPGAKILFSAGTIVGASIATGGISATQLANDAVTPSKIADEATVDLVTTLPGSGAFVGQLALDTDDLKVYCWDGSQWQSIKAAGSVNSVVGTSTGLVNISIATAGDTVTISTSLDNTSAAAQFLAGPTSASGAVGYRTIAGDDIPVATTTTKGGVTINGQGLRLNGNQLEVNNDVTAEGTIYGAVRYNSKGLVTAGRAITSVDLPVATSGGIGAVRPGTGLAVDAGGVINHTNTITPGTFTKGTVDAQGHISSFSSLIDTDIPNLPASKLTSGTLSASLFGTNSITGTKLSNYSTVQFGGAGSTSGVVTFPTPEFTGQMFFDANNGDLYLYDGNTWQPITVISGDLIYAGTYSAATNTVASVTTRGSAVGLTVGAALPAASATNVRYYVVVSQSGNGTSPAPAVALAPPDMIISNGATWDLVDVSNAIAGQIASNISITPYGNIAATNVQTAVQELDDEKVNKAGDTVTGALLIGAAGSFAFEGSTDNASETFLTVVDPTADRTITLPDATGTVVLSGAIVNADINASAAIVDTKLATIATAGKVSNSATTATNNNVNSAIVSRDGSGNFSAGTITAALTGAASSNVLKTGDTLTGNLILANQSGLRFGEATANGTNYVGFQAPATIATDVLWTLPATDGTSNQVLKTNGAGTLSWSTPTTGGVSLGLVIALS